MRPSSDTLWLIVAAAASVGVAPLIMRGDAATNTRRERSRQALEMMTPAERQRLDDSYERYKSFTSEERDRWKRLHSDIEREGKDDPAVNRALSTYAEWVPGLSALNSDLVRSETDPEMRVALISRIEQQQSDEKLFQGFGRPPFNSTQFYAAMEIVEHEAARMLTAEEYQKIRALPEHSPKRSLSLIQALRLQDPNNTFHSLISEAVLGEIVKALGGSSIEDQVGKWRQWIEKEGANGGQNPRIDVRRMFVRQQMSNKLLDELFAEMMKSPPTDEDLLKQLNKTSIEDRDRYYASVASDVKVALRREIVREQHLPSVNQVTKFFEAQPPWPFQFRGFGRGPEGRRGDGRRDADGPRGQREGRGPDDGNRSGPPGFGDRPPGRPDGPGGGPPPNENR